MNEAGKLAAEISLADSWPGIGLLFVCFSYFLIGSLGYGELVRRCLRRAPTSQLERFSDSILFATLFLAASAMMLASLQALQAFPSWIRWLFFLPGFLAALPLLRQLLECAVRAKTFSLLFLFVILLRTLTASLPSQHGDPLLYHLLGPRLWMEHGGFLMHPQLPNALLASTWELLYIWPQLFWFSATPLYGLIEAQVHSQWIHLYFGWMGCALLMMRLFHGLVRPQWLPLLGLSALFVSGLHWTAPLAKNDIGVTFWALGSIVYFVEAMRERKKVSFLLSGLFAGMAISGKITAIVSLGPLLAISLLLVRPLSNLRFIGSINLNWILGALIGAAPIYARNFIYSGNPFFPMFSGIFPSPWISKTWTAHFAQVHPSNPLHSASLLWLRIPELFRESPWTLTAILLLPAAILGFVNVKNEKARGMLAFVFASYLAYGLFVVTQVKEVELRYLGPSLMILAGGGLWFFLEIAQRARNVKVAWGIFLVLLAVTLATSKLPTHVLTKIWKNPLGVNAIPSHSSGEAKAWLRMNAGKDFTVVAGDNETYYLTPLAVAVLTERPDLDAATIDEKDFPKFIKAICDLTGAKFLLDSRPSIGVEGRFGAELLAHAKVFSAQGANIYSLALLEQKSTPGSHGCAR